MFFTSDQQSFSYKGMGLPGLNLGSGVIHQTFTDGYMMTPSKTLVKMRFN